MWFEPRMDGAPLEIPGSWAWRWKIKGISKASIIVVQVDCFFCCCSDVLVCSGFPPHPEQTNCGRNCGVSGILYWISLNSWRVKLNVTSTRCSAGWAKSDVFYCRAIKLKEWKYSVCAGYLPAIGKWTSKGIANWKVGQIASNQKQSIRNHRTPWEISFQHTPFRPLLQFSAVNLKCRQVICSSTRAEAANTSWGWFWLWSGNWIDQKKWFPNVTIK